MKASTWPAPSTRVATASTTLESTPPEKATQTRPSGLSARLERIEQRAHGGDQRRAGGAVV